MALHGCSKGETSLSQLSARARCPHNERRDTFRSGSGARGILSHSSNQFFPIEVCDCTRSLYFPNVVKRSRPKRRYRAFGVRPERSDQCGLNVVALMTSVSFWFPATGRVLDDSVHQDLGISPRRALNQCSNHWYPTTLTLHDDHSITVEQGMMHVIFTYESGSWKEFVVKATGVRCPIRDIFSCPSCPW